VIIPSDVSLLTGSKDDSAEEGRTSADNKEKKKSDDKDKELILRLLAMLLGK
tara:strand:+ start:694 stop:849 length:156 start_codon:yes stop_codon:yes gene_type:complete